MKRRILTALLAVCLVFALGTIGAFADEVTADSINNTISSATEPVNIKLEADLTGSITIPAGKTVVLDLNGFKITNTANQDTITVNGNLTINDSSTEKDGTVDNVSHAKAAVFCNVGGVVELNGGSYTRSEENGSSSSDAGGNSYYNIVNHGTMTINAGVTVMQSGGFSSMIENGWYDGNQNTQKVALILGELI